MIFRFFRDFWCVLREAFGSSTSAFELQNERTGMKRKQILVGIVKDSVTGEPEIAALERHEDLGIYEGDYINYLSEETKSKIFPYLEWQLDMTENYHGYKLQQLTAREEIASRILAGLYSRYDDLGDRLEPLTTAEKPFESHVAKLALDAADALLAKTRPEEVGRGTAE